MAGTRLAAHSCFLIFSLISVLVAWRLRVVKRAGLPLQNMADPYSQYPRHPHDAAAGSRSPAAVAAAAAGGPRPPAVDIDVVLLRSPKDRECSNCAAQLDAMQANPSLARNAFRTAAAAADAAAAEQTESRRRNGGAGADAAETSVAEPAAAVALFTVREVNLRVVHADHGRAAGNAAPPLLAAAASGGGGGGGGGPTALDDWLHRNFILPQRQQQQQYVDQHAVGQSATTSSSSSTSAWPRYTFFVACAGMGDAGELPTFIIGKRRHGYLGLGCACSSCVSAGSGSAGAAAAESTAVAAAAAAAGEGVEESSPKVPPDDGKLASATGTATAVLRSLAEVVVLYVLRSPVQADDVHVRLGQAYRLNFSLASEDPALRRCAWDFASVSRRYLRPLLRKLRPVASFAVQSQEVQYARLSSAPPRWYSGGKRFFYSPEDLQGFLGANDFSALDLAAGWGPDSGVGGGKEAIGNSSRTIPPPLSEASSVSSPHSQVPVNFMVFCPSPRTSPLVFMEEWRGAGGRNRPFTEAFEVPGFGGVSVANRGDDTAAGKSGTIDNGGGSGSGDISAAVDVLESERLRRAFGAHVSQLRRIIGLVRPSDRPSEVPWPLPPSPWAPEVSEPPSPLPGERDRVLLPLTFLPSPTDGVTDWEVDALLRAGMARNRAAAAETLRSLAALVNSQPEMEVSSKIAEDVAAALAALAYSDASVPGAPGAPPPAARVAGACVNPGSIDGNGSAEWAPGAEAMCWAREGLRRSEAAYFDPTMVPQLYFPQDHLMAVYFPFLAPLAFPLIFGFAQELLRYFRKRQKKKEDAKEQRRLAEAGGSRSEGEDRNSDHREAAPR